MMKLFTTLMEHCEIVNGAQYLCLHLAMLTLCLGPLELWSNTKYQSDGYR